MAGAGLKAFDLAQKKATIYDNGTAPFDVTNVSTIGLATARLLENAPKYANQVAYINSFAVTLNDVLAALEKATDTKWTVENDSTENLVKKGQAAIAEGDFYGTYDLIFAAFFDRRTEFPHHSGTKKLLNQELGLPKENLENVVREVVLGNRPKNPW